jgi:hypothetical protein
MPGSSRSIRDSATSGGKLNEDPGATDCLPTKMCRFLHSRICSNIPFEINFVRRLHLVADFLKDIKRCEYQFLDGTTVALGVGAQSVDNSSHVKNGAS